MGYNEKSQEEIRAAILKEAENSIFTHGIAGTEMKQIARAVGISRSTLYRYFTQKAQLALIVVADTLRSLNSALLAEIGDTGENGLETIRRYYHAYLHYWLRNPQRLQVLNEFDTLFTGEYPDVEEKVYFEKSMQELMDATEGTLHRGQADGSIRGDIPPRLLSSAIINMLIGLCQRIIPRHQHIEVEHGEPVDAIIDTALLILCRAISGEG